ncbi:MULTISPECIES: hypothetical protein [Bacillus]|nr:hypothetical protein [Bacillus glycinifermentans]
MILQAADHVSVPLIAAGGRKTTVKELLDQLVPSELSNHLV